MTGLVLRKSKLILREQNQD